MMWLPHTDWASSPLQSNRRSNLIVELGGAPHICENVFNADDSFVIEQAARALGNLGFNNTYTASQVVGGLNNRRER